MASTRRRRSEPSVTGCSPAGFKPWRRRFAGGRDAEDAGVAEDADVAESVAAAAGRAEDPDERSQPASAPTASNAALRTRCDRCSMLLNHPLRLKGCVAFELYSSHLDRGRGQQYRASREGRDALGFTVASLAKTSSTLLQGYVVEGPLIGCVVGSAWPIAVDAAEHSGWPKPPALAPVGPRS
jgi:hypothetical protein